MIDLDDHDLVPDGFVRSLLAMLEGWVIRHAADEQNPEPDQVAPRQTSLRRDTARLRRHGKRRAAEKHNTVPRKGTD